MPKLSTRKTDDFIELGIHDNLSREFDLLNKNLKASGEVFTVEIENFVEQLSARQLSEQEIIDALLNDFDNDGQIFGKLKRNFFGSTENFIGNVENEATESAWQEEGFDKLETWVAVLVNTCKDCLPRHGKTKTHDEWISAGLPRSGWSVCTKNCKCQLMPAGIVDRAKVVDPIKRVKGALIQIAKEKKADGLIKNQSRFVTRKLGEINNPNNNLKKEMDKVLKRK